MNESEVHALDDHTGGALSLICHKWYLLCVIIFDIGDLRRKDDYMLAMSFLGQLFQAGFGRLSKHTSVGSE